MDNGVAAKLVRVAIKQRRMREQHLPAGLFADPAWDMLLDLYAASLEYRRISVSSLCLASAVPPTTALRHINLLVEHGLVERLPKPGDKRGILVRLTSKGQGAMSDYFSRLTLRTQASNLQGASHG